MENDTLFWHGDQVWPQRLRSLREYGHLRRLILWGGSLTSERLAGLGNRIQLTAVAIGECPVNSDVLEELRRLPKLEFLNLSFTEVNGGFEALANAPIGELRLQGCEHLDDSGIQSLANWQALRALDLRGSG